MFKLLKYKIFKEMKSANILLFSKRLVFFLLLGVWQLRASFLLTMASQRDMFLSSPENSTSLSSSPSPISNSLPQNLVYEYLWVVLFLWDVDVEEPFNIYQLALFSPDELQDGWISGDLDEMSRTKKLKFAAIKGKQFSLFAKVEKCK